MCQVVNKYKVNMDDPDIVYIGRGSIWGNPFKMYNVCIEDRARERERVIRQFRPWFWQEIQGGRVTIDMLKELDGKRLACYCAPQKCHGDVIKAAVQWAKGQ